MLPAFCFSLYTASQNLCLILINQHCVLWCGITVSKRVLPTFLGYYSALYTNKSVPCGKTFKKQYIFKTILKLGI